MGRQRLHPTLELWRDIDDKRRVHAGRQEIMIDGADAMRRVLTTEFDQCCQVRRIHDDPSGRQMIGVGLTSPGIAIPVRREDDARTAFPDDTCNLNAFLIGIEELCVAPVEPLDNVRSHDPCGTLRFAFTDGGCPTRSHLALGEVDDSHAISEIAQTNQYPPCADFDVVGMGAER